MSLVELARIAVSAGTLLSVLGSSCLSTGCIQPQNAYALAGVKPPVIMAKKGWGGFEVSVGTNFTGDAEYVTHPDGTMSIKVKVDSQAGDVTLAQGQTAAMLAELRTIESARIIAQQEVVSRMMGDMFGMLAALVPQLVPRPVPVPAPVPGVIVPVP